ncbi:type II toxin-antitoxin system RelE/ParE family toxin [Endozoicomonas sp. ONNA2]|uniref:type II toxin-antitoxin system RelE family toxin n=1 Tax=Endozoicomonas sp. ONNA2 TaxID=2828741 RepID=UPI0021499137|nr:type II toxin-antitoxin system RelE/ParE family toxin [Endozoicomonas sp. ONNA2]
MFKVIYSKQAIKALRKVSEPDRSRMQTAINKLPGGDVKKLVGETGYRLRVEGWRIVYEIEHDRLMIEVIKISPRGKVYKH